MDDFSWVKPATNSLANIFGLNPEAAAQGRKMQAEQDFLAARTANTQADTGLSDYRRRLLEAQAGTQGALAGKYNADTGKTKAETEGISFTNTARRSLAEAFKAGAIVQNPDGSMTISPNAVNTIGSGLAAMDADPVKTMDGIRGLLGNAAQTPRAAAQTRGIAAAFEPNASFSAAEGKEIEGSKAAASKDEAIAVQQEKNKGSLAESIATGGAPRAIDLTRAANDAVKIGPEYIQSRYGQAGTSLTGSDKPFPIPEDLSFQITNAAQQKYPQLPINQAIDKVIAESGITFDTRGNFNPFISNETRAYARPNSNPQSDVALIGSDEKGMTLADVFARSGVAPAAAPAPVAPAPVAPTAPAPRSTTPDTHKGAPYYSLESVPGQPAPTAPAAPAAQAAQGMPDKAQFAAMPEGATVVVKGVKYVKQGRQLVKAQ